MDSLENLGLADMKSTHIPTNILEPLIFLRRLNISGNDFKIIPLKMLSYIELSATEFEELDISNNQLTGLNDNELNFLGPIRNVLIENNPFICDKCHVGALINKTGDVSIHFVSTMCSCVLCTKHSKPLDFTIIFHVDVTCVCVYVSCGWFDIHMCVVCQ